LLYLVYTTGKCNLTCTYCGGTFPANLVSRQIEYSLDDLVRFISDDADPVVAFYGGEPLMNAAFIRAVMAGLPKVKFVIQTNGVLAKQLDPLYWRQFDTVLLSIDGRRNTTDRYRGRGVYNAVLDAAKWLRAIGCDADLIARMTVSERSDILLDVKHLLSLDLFDHIHWQLNVVWSTDWNDFSRWCDRSYKSGIDRLIRYWLSEARNGSVRGIVPFIAILKTLLLNGRIDSPPCGAGTTSLSILPNGDVIACPIAVDVEWARLGTIYSRPKASLVSRVKINGPCTQCSYLRYCGGRCLYAHIERLWGSAGFNQVCGLTVHTIEELANIVPEVTSLLTNTIALEQLIYPPFNNTTELIP
jgi:putative peptide-modifying radical SAM enzyme